MIYTILACTLVESNLTEGMYSRITVVGLNGKTMAEGVPWKKQSKDRLRAMEEAMELDKGSSAVVISWLKTCLYRWLSLHINCISVVVTRLTWSTVDGSIVEQEAGIFSGVWNGFLLQYLCRARKACLKTLEKYW